MFTGALSVTERKAVAAWQKTMREIRKAEAERVSRERGHSRKRRSLKSR